MKQFEEWNKTQLCNNEFGGVKTYHHRKAWRAALEMILNHPDWKELEIDIGEELVGKLIKEELEDE